MNSQPNLQEHRAKANSFVRKALKYRVSDPDVAKICAFYAAYHAMRFAILTDPVFNKSDEEIKRLVGRKGLHQDSRYAIRQRHSHMSGYTAPQSMLDMVLLLEKLL